MNKCKQSILFMLLLFVALVLAACGSDSDDDATDSDGDDGDNETVESGGTLNVAIDAPPPTLDQPTSTATAARDTSRLIFESLVTTNGDHEPVPMLAESIDTDDNQTYTFKLREGILFHNGDEMTADDVVASMERWMEKSTITGNIFIDATWTAEDDYTVVLELVSPSSLTLDTLASAKQAAGIMPKDIVESAPAEGVEEYIGTGPFKFSEWVQDQYIVFEKYDDYQPVDAEADGLSGKKEALVDEIYFHLVPDTSTRVNGLLTGEYDFAFGVPYDNYDQFLDDPDFETILTPSANHLLGLNNTQGIASDLEMREVVNTALDIEEILMAAYPHDDFYWLDSGYMDVNIVNWASTAGSEYYNQSDPEKAKQMLEDMGYDGEEFRIMVTRDYDHHYSSAVVMQEQLNQIGMNAVLNVVDWPTLLDMRENDLGAWDAFVTTSSTVSTPPQLIALSPSWAGGVNDDHVGEQMAAIENAATTEEAQDIWDELQLYAWEELLPVIQIGGFHALYAQSSKVSEVTTSNGPIFWNVSISE